MRKVVTIVLTLCGLLVVVAGSAETPQEVLEQTLYVPSHSFVSIGEGGQIVDVTATLVVRNTDPRRSVKILSVRYHDGAGRLVRPLIEDSLTLQPLGAAHFVVGESDDSGGQHPSFLVSWESGDSVEPPLAEVVVVGGGAAGRGIAFFERGRVLTSRDR